jgi:hypothetical protein
MMNHLTLETVQHIIRLAEAVRATAQGKGQLNLRDMTVEDFVRILALSPEERRLRQYLKQLPEDQMSELMALMWLGRESVRSRDEYRELVEHASRNMEDAPSYVAEKAALAEYLRSGLAKLNRQETDG